MAVKIRLTRLGARRKPSFRLVVTDSRAPSDGRYIENIGYYDPRSNPQKINIDAERALYWLNRGVQPTDTAKEILMAQGIWQKYLALKKENKA